MDKYTSKVNWWVPGFAAVVLLICTIGPVLDGIWIAPVAALPVIALLVYSYTSTIYLISNDTLLVKAGFYRKRIPVASIRKITDTRSILTAPALTFERIEVFYDGYNSVEISPKKKTVFIAHLQRINPDIEYVAKTGK